MTPTAEQQAILDGFNSTTGDLKIEALAGCGKSATLLEIVAQNPKTSFLFMAFNRSIREELEGKAKARGLGNLKVRTQNGFCLELAKASGLQSRNISGYLSVKDTIKRLGLFGTDRYLAYPAFQVLTKFMISRDDSLTMRHVPKEVVDKQTTNITRFSRREQSESQIAQEVDKRVKRIVSIAQSLFESFDFSSDLMLHDMYVKLVQLHYSEIQIAEDVVLVDEAQDTNLVVADIIDKIQARKVVVGDSQQSIYQWRGATDYLVNMVSEKQFSLTQSFRFLPEIADKANLLLQHMTDLRLKGFKDVEEEDTSAILCRTNMGCLMEAVACMESEVPFRLEGGIDNEGFRMIEDIVALYEGNIHDVRHPDLKGIRTFHDFQKELEEDLLNNEWKTSLRVIDRMGGYEEAVSTIRKIKETQRSVPKNAKVITTMHKSKGKEWNSVRIADDAENVFYSSSVDVLGRKSRIAIAFKDAPVMEKNLFYVAVTRAKRNLELGLCERLFEREETANTTSETAASEIAA